MRLLFQKSARLGLLLLSFYVGTSGSFSPVPTTQHHHRHSFRHRIPGQEIVPTPPPTSKVTPRSSATLTTRLYVFSWSFPWSSSSTSSGKNNKKKKKKDGNEDVWGEGDGTSSTPNDSSSNNNNNNKSGLGGVAGIMDSMDNFKTSQQVAKFTHGLVQDLATTTVEGVAADGKVKVLFDGQQRPLGVQIDDAYLQSVDSSDLQTALTTAMKDAYQKSSERMDDKMKSFYVDLGM